MFWNTMAILREVAIKGKSKGKAIPLQAKRVPGG